MERGISDLELIERFKRDIESANGRLIKLSEQYLDADTERIQLLTELVEAKELLMEIYELSVDNADPIGVVYLNDELLRKFYAWYKKQKTEAGRKP